MGIENIWQHDPTFAVHWSIKDIHFLEFWITKLCTVSYISNLGGIKVVFVWMTKLQLQSKQITSKSIVSSKHLYYHYARTYEANGRSSSKWTQHYLGLSKTWKWFWAKYFHTFIVGVIEVDFCISLLLHRKTLKVNSRV